MALRDGSVQKAFWLRKGLAERLDRVIRGRGLSERRALALAIRAFVDQEEKALGTAGAPTREDLIEQMDEALAKLKALGASGA